MYSGFDSLLKNEKKQVFAKEKNKQNLCLYSIASTTTYLPKPHYDLQK